jgi:hypothetical protein
MRNACFILLAAVVVTATSRPAAAVLQFYKVFEAEHLTDHPDQDFATLVKKPANRCYICHVGKKRTHRNEFGSLMDERLDWKKDAKDKAKISAALKDALAQHVDPDDASSETYSGRLAASKFPGGELEELKKEPAGEEESAEGSASDQ